MRLDDFDPNAIDVEDQRGNGGNFPMGRGGQVGCGTLVVALILSYVFGVDPGQMIGGLQQIAPQEQTAPGAGGGTDTSSSCTINAESHEACNALYSLNTTWQPVFAAAHMKFVAPKLVFYSQAGTSGCGSAQSAMGPFYCPEDQKIYLDTSFYTQMEQELGATGQFARDYVIAHEYGHHIQQLTGVSDAIRSLQSRDPRHANQYSVMLELQADCYAGVWAGKNKDRIQPGDMESGLNAAHQIGDDTLMRNAGRNPNEAAFTHGSSAQRVEALRRGMSSSDDNVCNAYVQR